MNCAFSLIILLSLENNGSTSKNILTSSPEELKTRHNLEMIVNLDLNNSKSSVLEEVTE